MPVPPRRKTSFTGAIDDPIIRFSAELARAIQFHRLYPPEHPYVKQAASTVFAACQVALNKGSPFTIGATETGFFIEGEVVMDIPSVVEELARAFLRLSIHSITVSRGITEPEVERFVIRFGEMENAVIQGTLEEGAVETLSAESSHIELNTYSYEKVLSREGDLFRKVKDVAAETGEDEIDLLDTLLGRGGGALGGAGGERLSAAVEGNPGEVASLLAKGLEEAVAASGINLEQLAVAGGVLNAETGAGTEALQDRAIQFFDRIGSAMALHRKAGLSEVKNALEAIVSFLPPSSQELLFGKSAGEGKKAELGSVFSGLPMESRTSLLLNEILSGDSTPEQLKDDLSTVISRGAELATIVDKVSEQAKRIGTHESIDKIISRLSAALQSGIRAEALVRGTVYVVDPDTEAAMNYRAALAKEGFQVRHFDNGKQALDEIKRTLPDLLITEIKMHGVSGIEIIRALPHSHKVIPVIVATEYGSFGEDFEIATLPKHAFFKKPVEAKDLVEKVREFFPEKPVEDIEIQVDGKVLVDTEELESAQEVQQSLLPTKLPEIDGFDISVHYSPCREVGGDYYDVINHDDNCSTFVVADVSGKGVPAAMVMVMVRSLVHLSLPPVESPRDGIIELNRLLSKEIKQGLFVSAIYARVNAKNRTVTVCSAGQCPAALWMPKRDKPEVSLLKHTGVVLGLGDTSYFREGTKEQVLQFEPGAGVMIYTDGVIEAMNKRRKEFGTTRMMRVVKNSAHMSASEMNVALRAAVNAFSSTKRQHDDITILTAKCIK